MLRPRARVINSLVFIETTSSMEEFSGVHATKTKFIGQSNLSLPFSMHTPLLKNSTRQNVLFKFLVYLAQWSSGSQSVDHDPFGGGHISDVLHIGSLHDDSCSKITIMK